MSDSFKKVRLAHVCPHCPASFKRSGHLTQHIRSHTGERPYECDFEGCTKTFSRNDNLQRHKLSHNRELYQFKCSRPDCGKTFATKQRLQRHESLHDRPKPFSCDLCGAHFAKKRLLGEHHAREHQGELPNKCTHDGCDKAFLRPWELRRHILAIHTEKTYVCMDPKCENDKNAFFTRFSDLQRHLRRVHRNISHPCDYEGCDKVYQRASDLKKHKRIHEIPAADRLAFHCPIAGCNSVYTTSSNLGTHIQSKHTECNSFVCDMCDATFSLRSSLKRHILNRHFKPRQRHRDEIHIDDDVTSADMKSTTRPSSVDRRNQEDSDVPIHGTFDSIVTTSKRRNRDEDRDTGDITNKNNINAPRQEKQDVGNRDINAYETDAKYDNEIEANKRKKLDANAHQDKTMKTIQRPIGTVSTAQIYEVSQTSPKPSIAVQSSVTFKPSVTVKPPVAGASSFPSRLNEQLPSVFEKGTENNETASTSTLNNTRKRNRNEGGNTTNSVAKENASATSPSAEDTGDSGVIVDQSEDRKDNATNDVIEDETDGNQDKGIERRQKSVDIDPKAHSEKTKQLIPEESVASNLPNPEVEDTADKGVIVDKSDDHNGNDIKGVIELIEDKNANHQDKEVQSGQKPGDFKVHANSKTHRGKMTQDISEKPAVSNPPVPLLSNEEPSVSEMETEQVENDSEPSPVHATAELSQRSPGTSNDDARVEKASILKPTTSPSVVTSGEVRPETSAIISTLASAMLKYVRRVERDDEIQPAPKRLRL